MIYVALAETIIILVLIWVSVREREVHNRALMELLAAQETERQELINHIKHPAYFSRKEEPVPVPELTEEERRRRAAYARVGTIEPEVN